MAKKSLSRKNWLQATAVRVTRAHFLYVGIYMAAIIIFDSWNLYTHQAIGWRWTAAGSLLALTTVLWYLARIRFSKDVVSPINKGSIISVVDSVEQKTAYKAAQAEKGFNRSEILETYPSSLGEKPFDSKGAVILFLRAHLWLG